MSNYDNLLKQMDLEVKPLKKERRSKEQVKISDLLNTKSENSQVKELVNQLKKKEQLLEPN